MLEYLRVGTDPSLIRISSEPYVVFTARGYAPVIEVTDCKSGKSYLLFISARSIAEKLEDLRKANSNRFTGIEIWISKESTDRMARYVVEAP